MELIDKTSENPLRGKFDDLLIDLRSDLLYDTAAFKKTINRRLPAIFDLRLEVLRSIAGQDMDFRRVAREEISPFFTRMKAIKRYSFLIENIETALSLNKKVLDVLGNKKPINPSELKPDQIATISYAQFISTTYLANPVDEIARTVIDWVRCSLYIEYITLAAVVIFEEKLLITDDKIGQLSSVLGETNQAYAWLAVELNIINDIEDVFEKKKGNSRGAAIFKRMLDDKNQIHQHLKNGGDLSELKDKFNFANPVSFTDK